LKRRFVKTGFCLLLAICSALVLLWVRSHYLADGIFWKTEHTEFRIVSSTGAALLIGRRPLPSSQFPKYVGLGYTRQPPHDLLERIAPMRSRATIDWGWRRVGLAIVTGQTRTEDYWCAMLPYWVIIFVLSLALWPRRLWCAHRRWHRRKHGRCVHCGYDLRASIDRCPECGRPTSKTAASNLSAP